MAQRFAERNGASRRVTFQRVDDAHVLPAALYTFVQTFPEVHSRYLAITADGQPEEVVHAGGPDDIEAYETLQAKYAPAVNLPEIPQCY